MADCFGLRERDTCMPVVPMFHAMAWGTAVRLRHARHQGGDSRARTCSPRDLAELIQARAGDPHRRRAHALAGPAGPARERSATTSPACAAMIVGGAAVPQALIEAFEKKHGLKVVHAWGMTETSPLGTVSRLKSHQQELPEDERFAHPRQAGHARAVASRCAPSTNRGGRCPGTARACGELQVRGPWIAAATTTTSARPTASRTAGSAPATWSRSMPRASCRSPTAAKDLIKSGGEWISSVDLENAIMGHPEGAGGGGDRACRTPSGRSGRWPAWCRGPEAPLTKEEMLDHLRPHVARWALPDDIVFVERCPRPAWASSTRKCCARASPSTW